MEEELSYIPDLFLTDPCFGGDMLEDSIFGEDMPTKDEDFAIHKTLPSPSSDSGILSPSSLKSDDEFFEDLFGESFKPALPNEPDSHNQITKCPESETVQRPSPTIVFLKTSSAGKDSQSRNGKQSELVDEKSRKNAAQAKLNREKKKMYVANLEKDVDSLSKENQTLKSENHLLDHRLKSLEEEVSYLKGVLANQSALAGLLKNIPKVEGVNLTSSFMRKRNAHVDHDYPKPVKSCKTTASTSGVCLHVDKDNVSIEFCASCSMKAKATAKDKNH